MTAWNWIEPGLPSLSLDGARAQLLMRNLIDNALRHGVGSGRGAEQEESALQLIETRAGRSETLAQLGATLFPPDAARSRSDGGAGLGPHTVPPGGSGHGNRLSYAISSRASRFSAVSVTRANDMPALVVPKSRRGR